ncbi:MAG: DUF4349 domain-containing protein, partial [Polyangia bacterium]
DGSLTLRTQDVDGVTRDVRAHAAEVGAAVVGDAVSVTAEGEQAVLRLRLPPNQAVAFADWLGQRATLVSRRLQAADVSRHFVDQEVAIKNLQITIDRLRDLAQRPNAALNDVLAVERELTRVRGELEAIEGEHRLLQDQVARATLTVTILPTRAALSATAPVATEPELKFELVPHATVLHFLDDRPGRGQTRAGGGVSLMFARAFTLDFTFLPQHQADARSYLFGLSVAGYSDFLGGGRRRFLNPYLGLRLGAGSLDDHGAFLFGGEVGVELLRYKLFLVDLTGRALGVIHGHNVPNDVALEAVLGVGVPF